MAEICRRAPVVPVLVIDDPETAVPLAQALVKGGLTVLEITLRTPVALQAISDIAAACPDAVVGAGTLKSPKDVADTLAAGAAFGVSPGGPDTLLEAVEAADMPFLPGVATPTETMSAMDRGYELLKLFPAEAVGGRALLKSLSSPLSDVSFCPTGGIGPTNAPDYLALPNVVCVGGSWVAPGELVDAKEWAGIEALARDAAALG